MGGYPVGEPGDDCQNAASGNETDEIERVDEQPMKPVVLVSAGGIEWLYSGVTKR